MVNFSKLCCAARKLHPDLAARVTEKTLKTQYLPVVEKFIEFVITSHDVYNFDSPEEFDDLIKEFRTEAGLSRSKHGHLVAAVEFLLPHMKGKLIENREMLKGRRTADPVQHTVPNTKRTSCLMAADLATHGRARAGAGLVFQQETGLRPSELVNLLPEHVYIPTNRQDNISVRLGAIVSTKAKREQFITVTRDGHCLAYEILCLLVPLIPKGERLFGVSYWEIRKLIQESEKRIGIDFHFTPHSGRAGFASERIANGEDRARVQQAGRWVSEASFIVYIDVIGALHVDTQVKLGGLGAAADFCVKNIFLYLTPATLLQHKVTYRQLPARLHEQALFQEAQRLRGVSKESKDLLQSERLQQGERHSPAATAHRTSGQGSHGVQTAATGGSLGATTAAVPANGASAKGKGRGRGQIIRSKQGSIWRLA